MAVLGEIQKKYIPKDNDFYRNHYHHVIMGLMLLIGVLILVLLFVTYQIKSRPLPVFTAKEPTGKTMQLTAFDEPNLLPDTITRFASKGATAAYTFDYVNYREQVAAVRPYFTDTGWPGYLSSVDSLLNTITANKLFVNSVVTGAPVITNQGPLPGKGYTWRVQMPFLVTYVSANGPTQKSFYVTITIVRVPTNINPRGIGFDQFIMQNA